MGQPKFLYEMENRELLDGFLKDMASSGDSGRYGRSKFGTQIIRYGPGMLPEIQKYRAEHPTEDKNLLYYWDLLEKGVSDSVNEVGRLGPLES